MRKVSAVLSVLITMPIWYYILYTLLSVAHVDRLVWLLYFVYLPVGLFTKIVDSILETEAKKGLK